MLDDRAARGSSDPSSAEGRASEDLGPAPVKRARHGLTGHRIVESHGAEAGPAENPGSPLGARTESWPWRLTSGWETCVFDPVATISKAAAGEPEILGGVVRGTGAGGENTMFSFLGVTT